MRVHQNVSAARMSIFALKFHNIPAGDTLVGLVGMVLVAGRRRAGEVLRVSFPALNPQGMRQHRVFVPELVGRIRIVPA